MSPPRCAVPQRAGFDIESGLLGGTVVVLVVVGVVVLVVDVVAGVVVVVGSGVVVVLVGGVLVVVVLDVVVLLLVVVTVELSGSTSSDIRKRPSEPYFVKPSRSLAVTSPQPIELSRTV